MQSQYTETELLVLDMQLDTETWLEKPAEGREERNEASLTSHVITYLCRFTFALQSTFTSWWFQPLWKIFVKLGSFFQVGRGENSKKIFGETTNQCQHLAFSILWQDFHLLIKDSLRFA